MITIILIMLQVAVSCLGNEAHITVLNIQPNSNYQNKYQCYTPSIFTNYSLSYGRSFKIQNTDNLNEYDWTVKANKHKYGTTKAWNMGVYYCKIVMGGVTKTVQTTKIKSDATITPSQTSSSITVNVGDEVTISFDTIKDGKDLIWRKDTVVINSVTEKTLTFSSVNISDAGMYEVYERLNRENRNHAFTKLIVRACPRHKWGPPDCTGDCDYCYNGGVCDDKTGLCICAPGFMGFSCQTECGGNIFGWNCENLCTSNSARVGACKNKQFCLPHPYGCSCVTGFKGLNCNAACPSGKFGADCAQSCHCKQGKCSQYTGICTDAEDSTCAPPWTGSNCQKCEPGFFGENCEFECTKPCICHRLTGQCLKDWCDSNWLEPNCKIGIINTTFSPANDGHVTDVYCTVYHDGAHMLNTIVMVTTHDVNENVTMVLQQTQNENITSYHCLVVSDIDATYTCITLHAGETAAQRIIVPKIFRLPTYQGNLHIDVPTSSTISFNWTAWDNTTSDEDGPVIGYILHYRLSSSNTDDWKKSLFYDTLSGIASGLVWDTNYTFALSAVRPGEGGEGPIGMQRISVKTLCGSASTKDMPVSELNHYPTWYKTRDIEVDAETLKCLNLTYIYTVYFNLNTNEGVGDVVYRGIDTQTTIHNTATDEVYVISITVSNKDSESEIVESSLLDNAETSSPTNSSSKSGTDFSRYTAIVGGIAAAVCFVLMIVVFIIFWKMMYGKGKVQPGQDEIQLESNEKIDQKMLTCENVPMKATETTFSRRISISDLVLYVTKNLSTEGIHNEFDPLPVGQTRPWKVTAQEYHRSKNSISYNHSCVVLDKVESNSKYDYYNASYIKGYSGQRQYIACQGPNKDSLYDFWRMICQLKIEIVVMLTNIYEGKKCQCCTDRNLHRH
ncbi:uncharacterized protein LOC117121864 [Anneissia japonica]|uniref:uncharacterized protein LOC117121864 n=1 Tax=Anneissia japonica TaxID=1529436 RepID=UPI00142552A1|nr:uncharacterized protein LOC117121864 [Anneissia japonica]